MHAIGLDIGGANVKVANGDRVAITRCFPIWKTPDRLGDVLSELLEHFAGFDLLAVSMTAELADCFTTKAEGVDFVLSAVEKTADSKPIFVWQTGAEFVTLQVAREIPLLVAAANWHALATWLGRLVPDSAAVLIDVGSTTTDIIPLLAGVPVPRGLTDVERLQSGELVYSGVRRTPLSAIAEAAPFRGGYCPLAAEFFATTLDIYLTLGEIPEDPHDCDTANGKPATRRAARDRLARMLCCDCSEFSAEDADVLAHFLADVQKQRISAALERVLTDLSEDCGDVLIAGAGAFLAEKVASEHARLHNARVIRLAEMFDEQTSEAACAFALARLASERLTGLV